jgi:hypothetical protein
MLNQRISAQQQRGRYRQPKGFGGLEIDDQLELRWLLDRQISGLRALWRRLPRSLAE